MARMARRFALLAAAFFALAAISGCGVKGPLEPPPSSVSAQPDEIIDTTENATPEHSTSILDGLLQ